MITKKQYRKPTVSKVAIMQKARLLNNSVKEWGNSKTNSGGGDEEETSARGNSPKSENIWE